MKTDKDVQIKGGPMNRTGLMTAPPEHSKEVMDIAKKSKTRARADDGALAEQERGYISEQATIGSTPAIPGGQQARAAEVGVFLDKLGDRLAFERSGTRLYESMMRKAELLGVKKDMLQELRHIHDEELQHFSLLQQCITQLGGDPTVETPSADISGVISEGVFKVVSDPRTDLAQSLQAVLTAELTDNDSWQMLCDLARALGHQDLAQKFTQALEHEKEHLMKVRTWLKALVQAEITEVSTQRKSH